MADLPAPGAPGQFSFVKREDRSASDGSGNMAGAFARKALRDEFSKSDGTLSSDSESVLSGECIYLPEFHCDKGDFTLLAGLAKDMETHEAIGGEGDGTGGMINWSKHLKHENPSFSTTFKKIVKELSEYFDVEVYATRLNFYRDGTDWKPFHHDSHAYGGREQREDFTMGSSFGAERELAFLHEQSGSQFSFPQNNGDVFAFTTEVNKRFKHGVPKLVKGGHNGPRFSIIAWGRRRTLNPRNGGTVSCDGGESVQEARARLLTHDDGNESNSSNSYASSSSPGNKEDQNELAMGSCEVSTLIRAFLSERAGAVKREQNTNANTFSKNSNRLGGGLGKRRVLARDVAAASRAMLVPPGTPPPETRGSVPLVSTTRAALGEGVFLKLREAARAFQRGELGAGEIIKIAKDAGGVAGVNALEALVKHLPDTQKKTELSTAIATARVKGLEINE